MSLSQYRLTKLNRGCGDFAHYNIGNFILLNVDPAFAYDEGIKLGIYKMEYL